MKMVLITPPKHQNLGAWNCGANTSAQKASDNVWEIGVPAKNSLPWSIILSYLLSAGDKEFPAFLTKLVGNDAEREEIKKRKNLKTNKIDASSVKKRLSSFNPFKNRHAFFNQAKELVDVMRIFDLRLNQYATEMKKKTDVWNDEFKINAASHLLDCKVDVYFPEQIESGRYLSYPKSSHSFKSKIILFQYENQEHKARRDTINVFHFAMTAGEVHSLKLDALVHILKKTKIGTERIAKLKELMSRVENHGNCFLPTILQNEVRDILPELYKSPYITVKLSEAGFETNPIASYPGRPSPLCYAAVFCTDANCIRILYDYASNCHCLFDRCLRKADDIEEEALKHIKIEIADDLSKLPKCDFSKRSKDIAENILKQFILLTEYRLKTVTKLNALEVEHRGSKLTDFEYQKKIIEILLSRHLESFHSKYTDLSELSHWFSDYLNLSEYYENADNLIYCTFFDNFFKLRICINLKQENIFLNIEWRIFLAIMTNKYFLNFDYDKKYSSTAKECEAEYVLRYIPLLYRRDVLNGMSAFLDELKIASDSNILLKSLKTKEVLNNPDALPQLIDEVLVSQMMKSIDAALEVSAVEDGIRAVFAIERALQVIGESIKPPSSNRSSVSYLLQSCLPVDLQNALKIIRNTLSHYYGYLVHGRLTIEDDLKYFERLKDEIREIKICFEVVIFTQKSRLEELVMFNFLQQFENMLDDNVTEAFYEKYKLRVNERTSQYEVYADNCIQLVRDNISNLQKRANEVRCANDEPSANNTPSSIDVQRANDVQSLNDKYKDELLGWIKTINGLFRFIIRHKPDSNFDYLLNETVKFVKSHEKKKLADLKKVLPPFLNKCSDLLEGICFVKEKIITTPCIDSFVAVLKTKVFSDNEKEVMKSAIRNALKEAEDARKILLAMFTNSESWQNADEYLSRMLLSKEKVNKLRNEISSVNSKVALTLLEIKVESSKIEDEILKMLQNCSADSGISMTLLIKLTYQRHFSSKIYTSVDLPTNMLEKLEEFLTNKIRLLINRLEALKAILIDEDENIKETWSWGRSEGIKYHMKFLMRQRYMRDVTVRASLDMAYFDCMNILKQTSWKELYEKSRDLFDGINLRNLLSHRTNIPEAIGGILDENDFPSEMIEKILKLIEDLEVIKALLKLFSAAGVLEKENFVSWIKTTNCSKFAKDIKTVTGSDQWEKYLLLLPFIS